MKKLGHLVATDVRRFGLGIVAWAAVVVAGAVLGEMSVDPMRVDRAAQLLSLGRSLATWGEIVLCGVLVVWIVHAHPAVGSTAFWMTRPFPATLLAGAKLLLVVAVFAGIPAAVDVVLMLTYRMRAGDVALVALETLFIRGAVLAFVMGIAALTASLGRAIVLGGLVAAGAAIVASLALAWQRDSIPVAEISAVLVSSGSMPLQFATPTPGLLPGLFLLAGGLAALGAQYVRRSRRLSAPIGAAGLALAILSEAVQPFPIRTHAVEPPSWAVDSSSLRLAVAAESIAYRTNREWGGIEGRERRVTRATATAVLENLPPGWLASTALSSASLRFEDGSQFDSRGSGLAYVSGEDEDATADAAVRRALEATWMPSQRFADRPAVPLVVAREEELAPLAGRRAEYEGQFNIFLTRLEIAGTMPVEPGATIHDGGYRLDIEAVALDDAVLKLRARSAAVATMFDRTPRPTYQLYLRHRPSGDALRPSNLARDWGRVSPLWGMHVFIAPIGFGAESLSIWFARDAASGRPAFERDDAWLKEAELVLVRTTYGGSVTRTLRLPDFPVDPPAPPK